MVDIAYSICYFRSWTLACRQTAEHLLIRRCPLTLIELLPMLETLPRADKLHLIQLLAANIAQEDGVVSGNTQKQHPVWSPHNAFDGAATLLQALEKDKA